VDQFAQSIGDATEMGKLWGDQSGMYERMAKIIGGMPKLTLGQTMGMGQALSGLAMNFNRLVGITSYAKGGFGPEVLKDIVATANKGGLGAGGSAQAGIIDAAANALGGAIRRGDTLRLLKSGDIMDRFQGAQAVAGIAQAPWLASALMMNKDLMNAIVNLGAGGKVNEKQMEEVRKAFAEGDTATKGISLMRSQQTTLDLILGGIKQMVQLIGIMTTSGAAKLFMPPEARTIAERASRLGFVKSQNDIVSAYMGE
jgi:hypothetical protein